MVSDDFWVRSCPSQTLVESRVPFFCGTLERLRLLDPRSEATQWGKRGNSFFQHVVGVHSDEVSLLLSPSPSLSPPLSPSLSLTPSPQDGRQRAAGRGARRCVRASVGAFAGGLIRNSAGGHVARPFPAAHQRRHGRRRRPIKFCRKIWRKL